MRDDVTMQDKLRLAIVYMLTAAQPIAAADLTSIEKALQDSGAEVRALSYVRKVHSLSQQLNSNQVMSSLGRQALRAEPERSDCGYEVVTWCWPTACGNATS